MLQKFSNQVVIHSIVVKPMDKTNNSTLICTPNIESSNKYSIKRITFSWSKALQEIFIFNSIRCFDMEISFFFKYLFYPYIESSMHDNDDGVKLFL